MAKRRKRDKHNNYDYEVGYGRPPKHSRFKKGQSGNPEGRPKEPATFLESLNKQLSMDVIVVRNGKEYKISGLSAISQKYLNMILSGDYRFMKLFLEKNSKDVNIESYLYPEPVIKNPKSKLDPEKLTPEQQNKLDVIKAMIHGIIYNKSVNCETLNQNIWNKEEQ